MVKEHVLRILLESNSFCSGQDICEHLDVTRAAVWKAIQALREDGYEIEAVRNRGYRMLSKPDRLTSERIRACLHTLWAGRRLEVYEEVDSTNNVSKRLAEDGAEEGTLTVAEVQTAGRGRRDRPWSSPGGSGIWMSLLLRPEIEPARASMLTLVMAMAICRAVKKTADLDCGIKWPNDVVAGGKKLCGILTEMSLDPDRINYIVIGCGINVLDDSFPDHIREVATSIYAETGKRPDRAGLIAACMAEFERLYQIFLDTEDLSALQDVYNRNLVNCGREVRVLDPKNPWRGTARGIDARGNLLVETPDGIRTVSSGEVSVRGIYGYV